MSVNVRATESRAWQNVTNYREHMFLVNGSAGYEAYLQAQRHMSRRLGSAPQNSPPRKIPGGKAVVVEAVIGTLEAVLDSHTRSQHCPYPTRRSARVVAAGKRGTEGVAYQCSSKSWLIPPVIKEKGTN